MVPKNVVPLSRRQRRALGITKPMLEPWKRISNGEVAGYVTQDGSPLMKIEPKTKEKRHYRKIYKGNAL